MRLRKQNIRVSIIIVNYKVKKRLFECILSIASSNPKVSYEIIVIDNDDRKTIYRDLKKQFPRVKYIPNKNHGFGEGNNIGAKHARGEYLFFLNPDTIVYPHAIDNLVRFLEKNKKAGVVAPLLLNPKGKPYELQGTEVLTPLKAIFAYSFLNKLLPKNPISKKFWMKDWDKTKLKEVDVVPGTAFIISSKLFNKLGGFDENLFLYFEEYDLCKQTRDLGFNIFINPNAKVVHYWGESTKRSKRNIEKIFKESRFYYFKKHFGLASALFISLLLGINKSKIILLGIIAIGVFLRLYKLHDLMSFIGDQAWFYLAARDLILSGKIPLVGITSSQTWLHQGPLWTYMLAPVLFLSNYSPLSGAYLTVLMGVAAIFMIYIVGKELTSNQLGNIAAILYATSPMVVLNDRFAYHTSPIPLAVLAFIFCLMKWVQGKIIYFPLALFLLSILYNLELATVVFWPVIIVILMIGLYKKEEWAQQVRKPYIIGLSLLLLIIPMIPIIFYDLNHKFVQTAKYAHWVIFYKILKPLFTLSIFNFSTPGASTVNFLSIYAGRLFYINNQALSIVIIILGFINLIREIKDKGTKDVYFLGCVIILLCTFIPFVGFLLNNVPSEAYLPMFFPSIVIATALLINQIKTKPLLWILVVLISISNIQVLLQSNYLTNNSLTLKDRVKAAKKILGAVQEQEYKLVFKGSGEEFANSKANYEYLTWWLSRREQNQDAKKQIIIRERDSTINIEVR